jgi:hypothetical protein
MTQLSKSSSSNFVLALFTSTKAYRSAVYSALLEATSKGNQFHQTIRDRFPFTLLPAANGVL